jgi:hypothetical protein
MYRRAMDQPVPGRPIAPDLYPFPDDPERWLPWSRVERRLEAARNYWLALNGPGKRSTSRPPVRMRDRV